MTSRRLLDPVSKVLLDAADYMEKHGHAKKQLQSETGAVCLRGAIYAAIGLTVSSHWDKESFKLFYAADERVNRCLFPNDQDAYSSRHIAWNNEDERRAEEVVAALREAALMETENAD